MITIIDYGLGNLGSIANMLFKLGLDAKISRYAQDIEQADYLILPGVGHFDHGMAYLESAGLIPVLNHVVIQGKKPVLGICLGAQLLMDKSEEGERRGLGWIPGKVRRFQNPKDEKGNALRVPHMGWNIAQPSMTSLFDLMDENRRFYFVHSYYLEPENPKHALCSSFYGGEFVAGIQQGNITGVQFHPEKSHKYGMQFFKNYFKDK